jgi:hypothetical protein
MHAQWDRGFVANEYLESGSTTGKAGVLDNLPRIDYTSGSAQLLVEPSRTNICLNSEGVDSLEGGATATLDQDVVSPTGYKGGVVEITNLLGADNDRKQFVADIASADRGQSFSASAYVKGTSGETMSYQFKRITGTYVGAPKVRHTFSGEWERLDDEFTTLADTEKVGFHFTNDSDTADSIYIWGMQIEKGSFATSYIPTYGAQDTRASEGIPTAGAGVVDMSSFFQGDDFTLVVHFAENPVLSRDSSQGGIRLSDGDNQVGGFRIYRNSASAKLHVLFDPTSGDDFGYIIDGTKVAINRSGDDFKIFVDGSQTQSFTNVNFDSGLDDLKIWGDGSTIKITKLKLFDEALSDGDMVTETS